MSNPVSKPRGLDGGDVRTRRAGCVPSPHHRPHQGGPHGSHDRKVSGRHHDPPVHDRDSRGGARGPACAHRRDALPRARRPSRTTRRACRSRLMQDLARYWATEYDWRKCEARLNALPNFITEIDGLDIHFIHVRSKHEDALPLVCLPRLAGLDRRAAEAHRPAHRSDRARRERVGRLPRRDPVDAGVRVLRQADRARLGSRAHREGLRRAHEAPRLHAVRRAGRRLGRGRRRRDGPPSARGAARHPPQRAHRGGRSQGPTAGAVRAGTRGARRAHHVLDGWLRHRAGAVHPAADDRLLPAGLTRRAGGLDARPRHRQLLQDLPRVRRQRADGQPHPRQHPRQHHAVLADGHRGLGRPVVLGVRTGPGRSRCGRPGSAAGRGSGRLHEGSPARSSLPRAAGSRWFSPASPTTTSPTGAATSPPGRSPSCSRPRCGRRSARCVSKGGSYEHRDDTTTDIRTFRIDIADEQIDDLRRRIAATRWPSKELVDDRSQGVQLATIQELARYWTKDYDWRKCEARLNALPQFTTEIDGVDIHFIHVRSPHEDAMPLIMTHGWPGSIIELLETVGPLTDPTAHGGDAEDAFHLVLPSIPGYGFSGEPAELGWDAGSHWASLGGADAPYRLHPLCRPGRRPGSRRHRRDGPAGSRGAARRPHQRAHGGGRARRRRPTAGGVRTGTRGARCTQHVHDDGAGYFLEMATRPQTIGYALLDSPVALAAWMLDHDRTATTRSPARRRRQADREPDQGAHRRRRHALLADGHRGLRRPGLLGGRTSTGPLRR